MLLWYIKENRRHQQKKLNFNGHVVLEEIDEKFSYS